MTDTYSGLLFPPDFPDAIVVPAHPSNVLWGPTRPYNEPKVLVVHSPEEPVDEIESTPAYFAQANRSASTHAYADSDGDLYQMVPVKYGAIANGVVGRPYPASTNPAISLNYQSESIEVEGYAAGMHRTCPPDSRQWATVRNWIVQRALVRRIAIDRAHVIGHYEVSNNRTDPGTLSLDGLVADAQRVLQAFTQASQAALATVRIRAALEAAWRNGYWQLLHDQLEYIGFR